MPAPRYVVPLQKKTNRELWFESIAGAIWGVAVAVLALSFLWTRFRGSGVWLILGALALCEAVVLHQLWFLIREIRRRRRE